MDQQVRDMIAMDGQASTLLWIYEQLLARRCTFAWQQGMGEREFVIQQAGRLIASSNKRSDFYKVKAALLQARAALAIPPRPTDPADGSPG